MPDNTFSKETPKFDTAVYPGTPNSATPGRDQCAACTHPIAGLFYRINGKAVCGRCSDQVRRQRPKDSHSAYARSVLFGVGAAIVGLILYAGFTIATGFYIGYVSLAVGWMVGKAIMAGSKGIGGRRYQIAAILLTYAAVSMAAIPIAISFQAKHKSEKTATTPKQLASEQPAVGDDQTAPMPQPNRSKAGLGSILAKLALIGLASPFLELQDPLHGVIGLVILFVGIRIAWRLTQGGEAQIQGPYRNASAASA